MIAFCLPFPFCFCWVQILFLRPYSLPEADPTPEWKWKIRSRCGVGWGFCEGWRLPNHLSGPSHSWKPAPSSPLRWSIPPLQPPQPGSPGKRRNLLCRNGLLLWKPALGKLSKDPFWGARLPWGRGRGQTAPRTLPSHYPSCDAGQVT